MCDLLCDVVAIAAQPLAARVGLLEPHAVHAMVGAQLTQGLR